MLESWSDLPLFLHLQYLSGDSGGGGDCFSGVADGFQFMLEDLSRTAASSIMYEFRARSFEYRKVVDHNLCTENCMFGQQNNCHLLHMHM